MKKKDYVKPNAQVLSLYTDEFMEGGFHTGSNIMVVLTPVLVMVNMMMTQIQVTQMALLNRSLKIKKSNNK